MDINDLVSRNLINLEMSSKNQSEAIEQMAKMLKDEGKIEDLNKFIQGIMEREKENTTGFGKGVAIPHCKSRTVKEASISIGKIGNEGIEWNSMDSKPVKFIIMLAIPLEDSGKKHLEILSELSGRLMDQKFLEELINSKKPKDVIEVLTKDKIKQRG